MRFNKLSWCLVLLFAASTCFAQMYTVNDLGTLGGLQSAATGINNLGQVIGTSTSIDGMEFPYHGFRTAPNSPINPASTAGGPGDDIGGTHAYWKDTVTPWGFCEVGAWGRCFAYVVPYDINDSGQVVGTEAQWWPCCGMADTLSFRTPPNGTVWPLAADNGGAAFGINASGQAVGTFGWGSYAFSTEIWYLGTLGGPENSIDSFNYAYSINDSGQVVGVSRTSNNEIHAFRTAPHSRINPSTDDLGPGIATAINAFGQVAFLPFTGIDDYGQFVGGSSINSNGVVQDLNNLIAPGSGCALVATGWILGPGVRGADINNTGQIAANATCNGQQHAVRLDPVYKGFVQQPINPDGSSVFSAKRGVIPMKFAVTRYGTQPSCTLPATIGIVKAGNGTLASVDENTYSMSADNASNFRIDSSACQYVYNLSASSLGVGTYRVDISINGIMVGHAVFALR